MIETAFEDIGARVKIEETKKDLVVNVLRDKKGEYFSIRVPDRDIKIQVVSKEEDLRHLLLHIQDGKNKSKILCGHDERQWFCSEVRREGVSTVRDAMEALKPTVVKEKQKNVRVKDRNKRKNEVMMRQGEWFFVPEPGVEFEESVILKNEPIRRSMRNKAHVLEECVRVGGQSVYVSSHTGSRVFTEAEYRRELKNNPDAKNYNWRPMKRNAMVYARGSVRHKDHRTIELQGWHRVEINLEIAENWRGRRSGVIGFLD
ncbi:MAG: hypothetical protein H7831_11535 [Magnetococcus sp. WYHC-3]